VIGLPLGQYTVQETVPPAGYVVDPNTRTVQLSPNDPGPPFVNHTDQTITIPFLDNRPIVRITGLSYTNAPDTSVDQPDGINVGNTTFMVNLHNYGGADAVLADSSFVVSNAAPNTGLTCTGGNNLPITGPITAGQNNSTPITLSCHYDHPNGKTITGTLVVKYYTSVVGDTLERTASGSPATISFAVNPN
jgi:Prealbumin-like fold domain